MNLVEYRQADNYASNPIFPDPLILDMELQWKLSNLCRKCVREFHWTSGNFFSHFASCIQLQYDFRCLMDRILMKYDRRRALK